MERIAKGIWKEICGEPEIHVPTKYKQIAAKLDAVNELSDSKEGIVEKIVKKATFCKTKRGITITLPMNPTEDIYGFGLQFFGINHAGKRRFLKVNSDPVSDTGESHAPVPFYVSSAGYGVFVDTYRYTTFLLGTSTVKGASRNMAEENIPHKEFSESALYALKRAKEERKVIIDVPNTEGVSVFFFEGNLMECVQRYNLLSGGGVVPPRWGLEPWYRVYGGSNQMSVSLMAKQFKHDNMPIKVIGIEPGWHSHSYSCTYKWSYLFPSPDEFIKSMDGMGYKLNLWEHLFVYPQAPFYDEIEDCAGDYEVWNGLVPDFATDKARDIFKRYHQKAFIDEGISGFKLDECDNSDYNPSNWSFPDCSQFPSGMDGEQMHQAIGVLYQNLIKEAFEERGTKTYSEVRSSGAFAAPLPFVLYSDLYDHKQFITALVNSGFSGLLWCPEVRDCQNGDDLLRRLQTVIFSHQALVNAWRIPNAPWKQTDIDLNLDDIQMDDADYYTDECRKLLELRVSMIPYLEDSFREYEKTGKPPIRALVMDYPDDINTASIDDEYMFGDDILVCPLTYEEGTSKEIYLPEGQWTNIFTREKYRGGKKIHMEVPYNSMLVFSRGSTFFSDIKGGIAWKIKSGLVLFR